MACPGGSHLPAQPPPADDDADQAPGRSEEALRLARWQYRRLVELGVPKLEARLLADAGVSWHDAARLIARGCEPETAARILV